MRNFCFSFCCLFIAFPPFANSALAQQAPSPAFLHKIVSAYNAEGHVPGSLSLTGSGTWTAGSLQESGSLVETVLADGSTSESWTFPTVSHTNVQGPLDLASFSRLCSYTDAASKKHDVLGRNCFQGLPWFDASFALAPVYSVSTVITDVSTDADSSQGQVRLSYAVSTTQAAGTDLLQTMQKGMTINVIYDGQTALPRRLEYKQATDQNEEASVDIAVTFDDYRNEGGFMVPHHIARYLQRTLVLDFVVTNVSIQ